MEIGAVVFLVFWSLGFFAMISFWLVSLARYGFPGMMFLARIEKTLGEIHLPSVLFLRPTLTVYRLGGSNKRALGLKLKIGPAVKLALSLSRDNAAVLAGLVSRAASDVDSGDRS